MKFAFRGDHFWSRLLFSIGIIFTVNFSTHAEENFFNYSELIPDLYHSGAGTILEPYVITNWNDLHNVRQNLSAHFILAANLDQDTEGYTGIGDNWTPIGNSSTPFSGNFDGQGYVIYSLTISNATTRNQGLFGYVIGGTIKNIGVTDVNITTTYNVVGGLVGRIHNGNIENSYVTGRIEGGRSDNNVGDVGGLVGEASATTISKSYTSVTVVSIGGGTGGLVGSLGNSSHINDSYAMGSVTGTDRAGGLVGQASTMYDPISINNTYSTATVTSTTRSTIVGGLIGSASATMGGSVKISNSYWDTTTGMGESGDDNFGATGKTTAEMYDSDIFAAWKTQDTPWSFGDGRGAEVEGYEVVEGLPYLTEVTRAEDIVSGNTYTLFASGWGDKDGAGAYTITNTTQLQNINLVVNNGFDFELSNGIDLNGVTWTPIGNSSTPFSGNFDGKNNILSNLTINSDDGQQGLFGVVSDGSIKNLTLSNVSMQTSSDRIGTLVGSVEVANGKSVSIENIKLNDSNITSSSGDFIGGLIGAIENSNGETAQVSLKRIEINDLDIDANGARVGGLVGRITAASGTNVDVSVENVMIKNLDVKVIGTEGYVGGIAGEARNRGNGEITLRQLAVRDGDIKAVESAYVGGLVGRLRDNSLLDERNLFIGRVDGGNQVGGLVGRLSDNSVLNFGYVQADVKGHGSRIDGIEAAGLIAGYTSSNDQTITEVYAVGSVSHIDSNATAIGIVGYSDSAGDVYEDIYYHSTADAVDFIGGGKSSTVENAAELTQAQMQGVQARENMVGVADDTRWDFVNDWLANQGAYPIFKWESEEFDIPFEEVILFAGGNGTSGNPYQIADWTQLQNINLVANQGHHFILNNDLNEQSKDYNIQVKDGEVLANGGKGWTPIGSSFNNKFSGVFDGNGHTISNLEINSTGVGIGLFGWTDGATIKNVGLIDFNVKGEEFVGGLVGLLENSRVYQSYSAGGNVTAINQFVGGLVGRADLSEIEQSYSTGNVGNETNKGEKSGGLVGALFLNSSVKQSYASGNVFGSISVGGLVGFAVGTIKQSYANGAVEGDGRVGGLVGLLDTGHSIIESYATGKVLGNDNVGGLVGLNDGSVATSYFDKTINPGITDEEDFGKTTAELQSLTTFEAQWDIVADPNVLKSYPRLTHFVDGIDSYVWVIGTKEITLTGTYQGFSRIDNTITLILSEAIDATEVYIGSTEITGFTQDGASITITVPQDKAIGEHDIRIVTALGDLIYPAAYTSSDNAGLLFAFGDGTSGNPYQIADWNQLQNMTFVLDQEFHFILNKDLTPKTTGYTEQVKNGEVLANNGAGWKPISHTATTPTRFSLDGNNKTIQGLEINSTSQHTGLFGRLTGGNELDRYVNIKDLTITDAIVKSTQQNTGILIGESLANAQLHNIHVHGSVEASGNNVGGMIGHIQVRYGNEGNLSFLSADVPVTVTGSKECFGGLIGKINFTGNSSSKLTDSWARGDVSGRRKVGGLIGEEYSSGEHMLVIKRSYATGDVIATTADTAGGLIGRLKGKVFDSYATGNVQGPNRVGGLVGEADSNTLHDETTVGAEIHNSYATGNVRATNTSTNTTGGLVGEVRSNVKVINSYALGTVTIDGGTHQGGGLLGSFGSGVLVTNSFWNTTANPTLQGLGGVKATMPTDPEGLFGKTTAEMKSLATFTSELDPDGWDFENVWAINPTGWISYPYLKALDYDSPGETPENNPIPGLEQRLENTIEFDQLQDVVYGIVPFDPGATATSGDQVTYSSSNPDVADIENNLIVIKGVGETTITATLVNVFGYFDAIPVSQELKVLPKAISVEGIVVENKFYDGTAIASILGTANLEGVVGQDDVALSGEPVFTFEQANAGENINVLVTGWTLTGKSAINYTLKLPSLTGTIDKASLTITAHDKQKTYSEENPPLTFSYAGLVNNDSKVSNEPSIATTATASSDAGIYAITLSGGSDDNYDIELKAGTLTIGKKSLTITADNKQKAFGEENPALTFTYSGLVNGDTKIATEPSIATTATASSNVGTYPIELTGGSDANYDI